MASATNIGEWLDRCALAHAERPAVEEATGRFISYGESAKLSRRVSARLSTYVDPGDRVGVFMKKSIDTLIAFQAVLRCGAAYVPADPLAPASRAAFMFNNCEAAAVIVDEALHDTLRAELSKLGASPPMLVVPTAPDPGHRWRMDALASEEITETAVRGRHDLAFLLYTSGSTGTPKAVMLTHGNVVSFIDWCSETFAPSVQDKFATHAPLQFSLAVFNLYLAWKHGAAVVLIDEQSARVAQLVAPLIEARGITVWFSTPTILSLLAQSGELQSLNLASLRLIMFAGEPFPVANLRALQRQLPHPRYVHVLGSTETHIMAHCEVPKTIAEDRTAPIPVGRVCAHFRSRVLDEEGNDIVSPGDGELCLSGPAVTPGYWRNSEQRDGAFFTDSSGERWYRTGDIVRVAADGELTYRSRRDRMIKRRGNRVELGEIESCLYGNATVKEAAIVAVDDDSGVRLHAFVVPHSGTAPSIIALKAHCARSLPAYMVPDAVTFTDRLPRTSTGKVDFPTLKNTALLGGLTQR